jgi:hypothetical protein
MKVFFDTNVYVAEALLGEAAEEMVALPNGRDGAFSSARICLTSSNES